MERAVATCRHTKLATLLTLSELIKAGGSALVKLLLKLVNWVWELETLPTAWSQIVNLFKAGDSCQGLQGITLVSICRKMFTNMLRKRMESRAPAHEAQAAFRSKDPAQTTCSCSRASSKRLARPTKLSMRSF
jgi:hypothetical protein